MKLSDLAKLLLLAALWGASFLFMRIAVPVLGPVWLIEFRVLVAGLVLLPLLARLNLWREVRQHAVTLAVVGTVNAAVPFLLFAFASIFLPAGFLSILNATVPLFGIMIASVWLKEKLTMTRAIGFGLGFAGVVILVGWQAAIAQPSFFLAVLAGLCAAFMYAICAPIIKQKLTGVSPLVVTTGSQLSAALVLLPALPFTVPQQTPTIAVVLSVLALALLSTVWAYFLYLRLIHNIGPTKALTVAYLIPLFAMFWGALVLKEVVTVSMILGCGLILLGTAIANELLFTMLRSDDRAK